MMDHCIPVVPTNDKAMFSESLQEQLYLANVLKEFFHLQLLEQQTCIDNPLCSRIDEIPVITPHTDVMERNKNLEAEICQCRSQLEATIKENVELQNLLHNLKEQNDFRAHEKETEMKELEKRLNDEMMRLSAELVIFQDEKSVHNQQQSQLNADLEQLMEENIILQSKLEIHKAKLAEVAAAQVVDPSSKIITRSKHHHSTVDIDIDDAFESNGLIQLRSDSHDSASAVAGMKGYLEEAQKMVQSLESAMDEMHAHKATASAGISKLIRSFESKSLGDGHGSEEAPSPGGSLYASSKAQFGQLRIVLETLTQNNEHVSTLIMKEKDIYNGAIASHEEVEAEIESLKGFNDELELRNIELEVLWGAMNEYLRNIEAKKAQLFDALKGQEVQLKKLRGIAGEVASVVSNEVETLQREMNEGIHAVETRWKSSVAELSLMVEKLDVITASTGSYPHHNIENIHNSGVFDHFSLSLSYACEVIEQLKTRVEVADKDHETLSNSYIEVNRKFDGLNEDHNSAIVLLHKFFNTLVRFLHVSGDDVGVDYIQIKESNPLEPLDPSYYEALLEKTDRLLDHFVQLKESNGKLYSDLLNRTNEIEDLKKKVADDDVLLKVNMDIKDVLKLQNTAIDLDEVPVMQLQSFVLLLIERYKEVEEKAYNLSNNFNLRMMEYDELQGRHVEWLEFLNFQLETEVLLLRESLTQSKDALDAVYVELLDKSKAFEQSEQRVASIREKLSIAVAKGKGLVVQRDSLKQSLSEMSTELEKRLRELRLKESDLQELEERLKAYSEAGERMEALESELSYIRNSATALRESFLMKDNTLLRIEEILEDLELPEQFHTKDITEKVDWLAKAVARNSSPPADWERRSSVGGGSYSDAGFITDGCKEDTQSTSNLDDDLKRKCDEMQTKLYEMAEQNEMLEQSLMDRNILVQRWEEILDRIHTPPQIRAMEPVERIHWLGTAVSEADNHMRSLQKEVESLENYCRSLEGDLEEAHRIMSKHESSFYIVLLEKESALTEAEDSLKSLEEKHIDLENYCESLSTDLAESRRKTTELESLLRGAILEKETFANDVVSLSSDRDRVLDTVAQYEQEVDRLGNEVDSLQKQKLKNEDHIQWIDSEMKRLQHLILDVLPISGTDNVVSYENNNIQDLEMLLRRLINHIKDIDAESCELKEAVQEQQPQLLVKDVENHHSSDKPDPDTDDHIISRSPVSELPDVVDVSKELSSALDEIRNLREERDVYMQSNQSLATEIETLKTKVTEIEEVLKQEEHKSASLREKLNLAVRKGKSLVQQRDCIKQNIEEMTTEIDRLKSKINTQEHALLESAQKINDSETENSSLRSRLMETEQLSEQTSHTLNMLLTKLGEIDAGDEINNADDPLHKLEQIAMLCSNLSAKAAASQQEASKSKKAAELLLAELNEVQERNDGLQEEVMRTYDEMSNILKERDIAESAKDEALSHLAKLSEERKNQLAEFEKVNSDVDEVKKGFFEISALIGDLFVKNKEHLQNLSSHVELCLEHSGVELASAKDSDGLVSVNLRFKDFWSRNSLWDDKLPNRSGENVGLHFQQLAEAIGGIKDSIHSHSMSLEKETEALTTMMNALLKSIISQKDSFESMKGLCTSLESTIKEKDMEGSVLRKSICFLYDACLGSITEIERRKSQLVGQTSASRDLRVHLSSDGVTFSGAALSSSENCVKTLAEELLLAVKDYVDIVTETVEGRSSEMRSSILNLQKELQEKDIQRERICMELVSQIKEAENSASNYASEVQSMKSYAQELESKLEMTGKKQTLLERQVEELMRGRSSSMELEEKVNSLNGLVAAKDQEIEVLMQALDEEENQMDTLRSRVDELQKLVEKKSIDLEHAEASRAKAVKKLAVTVSKFDELHHMSQGLLSEVENLQTRVQDRDEEISFLRKEVTRCTNDVLEATKKAKERSSVELVEFLKWLDEEVLSSVVGVRDTRVCFDGSINDHELKENIKKDIVGIMSELGDKDALLQAERSKVEELSRRKEELEVCLRENEVHVNSLHGCGNTQLGSSEIVEVEPMLNKWSVPVNTSGTQVRSLRKVNNDQVSIAIDSDAADNSGRFEDDEDDKVHGFKSLTTSRFVPKFTRPASDMIDGLWVSCDRALMRQPAFRLGIMIYWAVLHALLASLVI